ncbi:cytochrome c biogenesis CcdA family protein [Ornithinimicrobium pratense]|uniref:Cytochrome c biogenesis protein CcdA n=1 Tax=Ornithinimicrobium pratense TaxID=2593973 RepID=A0A5J6V2Z0_9MICO|nr:cytochrome c biogenesis protein CcdA [Ornithinimicrobium pratense]QFG67656.1 cytochrome c biogenesis protein CcdA [Ornithinimicrobium pratense]
MNEVVLSGPLLLAGLVAALAGLVSFASPCVLPLVPGFLGYVSGMTPAATRGTGPAAAPSGSASPSAGASTATSTRARTAVPAGRGRLMLGAVLFVLGFTAVFLAMSVVISGVGLALTRHQGLLLQVAGAVVVLLGLVMMLQPSAGWQVRWRPAAGLAGAPLLGVAFGLGFTACTGPALVAIQTLGTSIIPGQDQVGRALVLGTAYSLGLGLPFLLMAAGLGWVSRASRWVRDHYLVIQRTGGGLLILLGLLMLTGFWAEATAWVQTRFVSGFETVL